MIPAIEFAFAPAWKMAKGLLPRRQRVARER